MNDLLEEAKEIALEEYTPEGTCMGVTGAEQILFQFACPCFYKKYMLVYLTKIYMVRHCKVSILKYLVEYMGEARVA